MGFESRRLLEWIGMPDASRGGHFAQDDDTWRFTNYADMALGARRVGSLLREHGVRAGDTVAILHKGDADFVSAFFGALLAGATPAPIAPPMVFHDAETYHRHLHNLFTIARPTLALSAPTHRARIEAAAPHLSIAMIEDNAGFDPCAITSSSPEIGLIQFTSGSSGHARGVRVPLTSLEGNINAIRRQLGWSAEQAGATWLPVYHDMGLIGCLLAGIVNGCDGWVLQPEHFIMDPLR